MVNNRLLKYSVCTLLLIAAFSFMSSCSKTPDEMLKNVAQATQSTCPQIIDEYTTMISVEALPNRKLKYTYLAKTDLSVEEIEMAKTGMKKVLLDQLIKQPELEFYQANDVSFEHVFQNKDGETIVLVNIDPADYK